MKIGRPHPGLVERFRADLERLTEGLPERLGVAVSGGPDSLALLILAAAAYPGVVEAATVDHGLRPESAAEAAFVDQVCQTIGVPHATLRMEWPDPVGTNIQARARGARYSLLTGWALDRGIGFVATAHHLNDQAETVLMRLGRGAGVSGLAGTRACKPLGLNADSEVHVVRPLLGWLRAELASIVSDSGIEPVQDPSNDDERFDRTRVRQLLSREAWPTPERLAASAANLADAEEALQWATSYLLGERSTHREDGSIALDARDLPRELQRRMLQETLPHFIGCDPVPGPKLARWLDGLRAGKGGTLADIRAKVVKGHWHLDWAPPRRDTSR